MTETVSETVPDLFVYGTLMPHTTGAFGSDMRARLAREGRSLGAASVCARLYDLGQYPGLVPSSDPGDAVHGIVMRLADPAASLPWLDAYEGLDGAQLAAAHGAPREGGKADEYERRLMPVRLSGGTLLSAWVYVCRLSVDPRRLIAEGRWRPAPSRHAT